MSKNTELLITGATGFLGSHILNGIILNTCYKVIVLKRSSSNCKRITNMSSHRIKFYDADKVSLDTVFSENKISVIIHTATEYGRNEDSCYKTLETNLILPIKIIEIAIKYKVDCFINTDTFFNKPNFSYFTLPNYSLSKQSLLIWLKHFSEKIKIINISLEHVYGPYDNSNKFVENMIQKISTNEERQVDLTFGHQKRDFIFIDDVVDAYLTLIKYALSNKFRYSSYEIGSSNPITVEEFIKTIKELSNSKTKLNFGAIPYRKDEIMYSCANIVELENMGWKPKYDIKHGISNILRAYKKD